MAAPSPTDILVELHVPDFSLVEKFYSKFGFTPQRREENYLVLAKGESVINFYGGSPAVTDHSYFGQFPNDTKRGFGVELVLRHEDVTTLFERIKNEVKVVAPLTKRHWGKWDFRVEDPFGYYIRVTER